MRATYFISFNGGSTYTQFYPSNEPKVKLTQEPGEIFFRWRVDSFKISHTKNANVYNTLSIWHEDSTMLATDIKYQIKENGVKTFQFIAPIHGGGLDPELGVYECTPDPDDAYRSIMLQYEKKWSHRVGVLFEESKTVYLPVLGSSLFVNGTFDALTDTAGAVSWTHDGNPVGVRNCGNNIPDPLSDNTTVVVFITNAYIPSDVTLTMVLVDTPGGTEYSNKVYITSNGKYELLISSVPATVQVEFEVLNTSGNSKSGTFNYTIYNPTSSSLGGSLFETVLGRILNDPVYLNLGLTIVSTILWNDTLGTDPPDSIDTYMTANPNNDYVLETAAVFNYLAIGRGDSFTTAKTTSPQFSLKDIMDSIKAIRLWWFIDEDGKFRIEHEKYFRSFTPQVNLTRVEYASQKPEVDRKMCRYDLSDVYNQVNFKGINDFNEDWTIFPRIEFDTKATSGKVQDLNYGICTDVKRVAENPGDADNAGLVLIRLASNSCVPFDESEITPGVYYPNQKLSWAWLAEYYMNYFADAETGTNANGTHTFTHCIETLHQDGVKFYPAIAIDWRKPFTLSKGDGWLRECEYAPETGWAVINVGFNPYD